jgi:HNH endonuclease
MYDEKRARDAWPTRLERADMDKATAERFWAKVNKDGDCWVWTGARSRYGNFRLNGASRLSHRVAFEALVGPIPPGLELDHLCRNRYCVNPAHLSR